MTSVLDLISRTYFRICFYVYFKWIFTDEILKIFKAIWRDAVSKRNRRCWYSTRSKKAPHHRWRSDCFENLRDSSSSGKICFSGGFLPAKSSSTWPSWTSIIYQLGYINGSYLSSLVICHQFFCSFAIWFGGISRFWFFPAFFENILGDFWKFSDVLLDRQTFVDL